MKVAFATQDFQRVDAHFGWAKNIAIYDVSADAHSFVEVVRFDGKLDEDGNEDKLGPKLEAIKHTKVGLQILRHFAMKVLLQFFKC